MFRRIAVLGILLAAACGTDSSMSDAALHPSWPVGGEVRTGALITGANASTSYKVVLKARTSTPTFSPIYLDDGEGGRTPLMCPNGVSDCAAKGFTATNVACQTTAMGAVCGTTGTSNSDAIFFVQNSLAQPLTSFTVPCDPTNNAAVKYVAEVYGATGTVFDNSTPPKALPNVTLQVQEAYISDEFVMNQAGGCTATPLWNNKTPFQWPTPVIPKIYQVGLPAPLDQYAVTQKNAGYPWDSTYYITNNGTFPTNTDGSLKPFSGMVTYAAPATTAAINFQTRFHLGGAVLTAEDVSSKRTWEVQLPSTGFVPTVDATQFTSTPWGAGTVTGF